MKSNKAFTLIELLVVIAIIAILAAIVLVNMSGAQDRAKDARITSDMNQIRSDAQTFYSAQSTYTGYAVPATLSSDISAQGGTLTGPHIDNVATVGESYCAYALMNNSKYWCVDSELRSKQYDAAPATCVAGGTPSCE
jgi:prepilin-type N-terminal cleavage/methylation domain-containing protein